MKHKIRKLKYARVYSCGRVFVRSIYQPTTKGRQLMATKPLMVKVMVFLKKAQVQRLDSRVRKSATKTNRSALIRTAIDAALKG